MAEGDVNRFLTHLAVRENVAASTQNQALAAVLFLYEHVLERPLNRIEGVVRARKPKRLPAVLTPEEVEAVLGRLEGVARLVAMLLYGGGLRLLEALRGGLEAHLREVEEQHARDLQSGQEREPLPEALGRKYPTPTGNGYGSGCFRRRRITWIGGRAWSIATRCTNR